MRHIPIISVLNRATIPLGVDLLKLVVAARQYVEKCLYPIWNVQAELLAMAVPNAWQMVFLDNADQADALGYHDVTAGGVPLTKIFVKDTLDAGSPISTTFSHELGEMLVDPICQKLMIDNDTGDIYPLEIADAVEETDFDIQGIRFSNFVTPAWFESYHPPGSVQVDFMNHLRSPFELEQGGYAEIVRGGQWHAVFGSEAKLQRFAKEDRRMHRTSDRRKSLAKGCNIPNHGDPHLDRSKTLIRRKPEPGPKCS